MKNLLKKFLFIILFISSTLSIRIQNSIQSLCLCINNNKFYSINKTKKIKNFTRSYEVIL